MWSRFCVSGFGFGAGFLVRGRAWRSGVGGGFATAKAIWERRVGFGSPGSGGEYVPCLSCGGWGRRWIPSSRGLVVDLAGLVGRGSDTLRCCSYHLEGVAFLSYGHGRRLSLIGQCVSLFHGTGQAPAELGEVD